MFSNNINTFRQITDRKNTDPANFSITSKELFSVLRETHATIRQNKRKNEGSDDGTAIIVDTIKQMLSTKSQSIVEKLYSGWKQQDNVVDNTDELNQIERNKILEFIPEANLDACHIHTYRTLLPYARLMYGIEKNGVAEIHAFKLAIIFDTPEKALNFLSNYFKTFSSNIPDNQPTLHNALLFTVPQDKDIDWGVWRVICAKYMCSNDINKNFVDTILPRIYDLQLLIKEKAAGKILTNDIRKSIVELTDFIDKKYKRFRELEKKDADDLTDEEEDEFELLIVDLRQARLALVEFGIPFSIQLKMTELTAFKESLFSLSHSVAKKIFDENSLTQRDFEKFLKLERKNNDAHIPNVLINGETLNFAGYYLMKVDVMDDAEAARAACLGKLTDCCQSLSGEAGEPCVVHGLTSEYGGFYILCQGNIEDRKITDRVVGQCWAWRSQSGAIVFDSVEVAIAASDVEDFTTIVLEFYQELARALVMNQFTNRVTCGKSSGISSKVGVSAQPAELFIDYNGYCDSSNQLMIADKDLPVYWYNKHTFWQEATRHIIVETLNHSNDRPLINNPKLSQLIFQINWALVNNKNDIIALIKEIGAESSVDCNSLIQEIIDFLEQFIQVKIGDWISIMESNPPKIISDIFERILHAGKDWPFINIFNSEINTLLHFAVYWNRLDVVKAILAAGTRVNAVNAQGSTAINVMNHSDLNEEIILELIKYGAKVRLAELCKIILSIPLTEREAFINEFGIEKVKSKIENGKQLFSIVSLLPANKREAFLSNLGYAWIGTIITTEFQLVKLICLMPGLEKNKTLSILLSHCKSTAKIPNINIDNPNDLFEWIKKVIIDAKHLRKFFGTGSDLRAFPESEAIPLIEGMGYEWLRSQLGDANSLSNFLGVLPKSSRKITCTKLGFDWIQSLIPDANALFYFLDRLTKEQQNELIENIGYDWLKSIIFETLKNIGCVNFPYDIHANHFLRNIKFELDNDGALIFLWVKNSSTLAYFFNILDVKQHPQLVLLIKDKLDLIISDFGNLRGFLNAISKDRRYSSLLGLGLDKIKSVILKVNHLILLLDYLEKSQIDDFISQVGNEWIKSIALENKGYLEQEFNGYFGHICSQIYQAIIARSDENVESTQPTNISMPLTLFVTRPTPVPADHQQLTTLNTP